jgi:hypothetical protein
MGGVEVELAGAGVEFEGELVGEQVLQVPPPPPEL